MTNKLVVDPRSLCPQLNLLKPPEQNSWVRNSIYEKVSPPQQTPAAASQPPQHRPLSHDTVHCTDTVNFTGVHLLPQSAAVSCGLSRNILLTKPHVTHKTVGIKAYKVTDFKTEIRCGQNGVQQFDVVWQKFSSCYKFQDNPASLANNTVGWWGAKWTVASGNCKVRMILGRK
jgi:hypothetical protein